MSRNPRQGSPALLRLALRLAPDDRRPWLEDMVDEYAFVAARHRGRWQLEALALALRWRIASWQRVPASHFAVAVAALALLAGSPWLLRSYLQQVPPALSENEILVAPDPNDNGPRQRLDGTAPAESARDESFADTPGDDALGDNRGDSTPGDSTLGDSAAEAQALDAVAPPAPTEGRIDAAEQEAAENSVGDAVADLEQTRPNGAFAEGDALPDFEQAPADGDFANAAPDPATAPAAAAVPESLGESGDADTGQGAREMSRSAALPSETAATAIEGDTATLTVIRSTRLTIRSGLDPEGTPLVDREVEAGERFLLLLPVHLSVADGAAIEIDELGAPGVDGQPFEGSFVSQPDGSEAP